MLFAMTIALLRAKAAIAGDIERNDAVPDCVVEIGDDDDDDDNGERLEPTEAKDGNRPNVQKTVLETTSFPSIVVVAALTNFAMSERQVKLLIVTEPKITLQLAEMRLSRSWL